MQTPPAFPTFASDPSATSVPAANGAPGAWQGDETEGAPNSTTGAPQHSTSQHNSQPIPPSAAATGMLVSGTLSLEVVAEQAIISVPHDEAPMRVYILSEVWAKAVKQVGVCVCMHMRVCMCMRA